MVSQKLFHPSTSSVPSNVLHYSYYYNYDTKQKYFAFRQSTVTVIDQQASKKWGFEAGRSSILTLLINLRKWIRALSISDKAYNTLWYDFRRPNCKIEKHACDISTI